MPATATHDPIFPYSLRNIACCLWASCPISPPKTISIDQALRRLGTSHDQGVDQPLALIPLHAFTPLSTIRKEAPSSALRTFGCIVSGQQCPSAASCTSPLLGHICTVASYVSSVIGTLASLILIHVVAAGRRYYPIENCRDSPI